ncbi:hypothetical protein [Marininema halotolerans]|uniref:Uncharacterized protein n=1 Tax=Marininema halotolerans TaxID=1155944 RepID=A0A1I6UT05_9BACL|nr:hypothetical protein [Marininema halotolerans]SFT04622.1 hypothetical protein SAMN05444972_12017 [Marininema halotolerans]
MKNVAKTLDNCVNKDVRNKRQVIVCGRPTRKASIIKLGKGEFLRLQCYVKPNILTEAVVFNQSLQEYKGIMYLLPGDSVVFPKAGGN